MHPPPHAPAQVLMPSGPGSGCLRQSDGQTGTVCCVSCPRPQGKSWVLDLELHFLPATSPGHLGQAWWPHPFVLRRIPYSKRGNYLASCHNKSNVTSWLNSYTSWLNFITHPTTQKTLKEKHPTWLWPALHTSPPPPGNLRQHSPSPPV